MNATILLAPVRLNKIMARRGICSTRKADDFIRRGLVTVDGMVTNVLGVSVPENARIELADEALRELQSLATILLNKPLGYVTDRIEGALNGYNENKSFLSPKQENPALIASLVKNLAEVDPSLIEPVVLELYSYVIEMTKSSISDADKIELAKRLTDPVVKRKSLGDF